MGFVDLRWYCAGISDNITNSIPRGIDSGTFSLASRYILKMFSFIFLYISKIRKNRNVKVVDNFKRESKHGYAITFKLKYKTDLALKHSFSLWPAV